MWPRAAKYNLDDYMRPAGRGLETHALKQRFPKRGPRIPSQGFRGYISVMVTLKLTYFLIKGIKFC